MKLVACAIGALLVLSAVRAQPRPGGPWERTYGGTNDDEAHGLVVNSDGGYTIAGHTKSFGAGGSDMYLVRTNSIGDTLWTRTYGGPNDDDAASLCKTQDGGYALGGSTRSFGLGGADLYLVKVDGYGGVQWTHTYGGTADDVGSSIIQTRDGGFVLAGRTGPYYNSATYVVATDAIGDTMWSYVSQPSGNCADEATCVKEVSGGGYVVVGHLTCSWNVPRPWLKRFTTDGDTLWTRALDIPGGYLGSSVWAYSVEEISSGGFVISGATVTDEDDGPITYYYLMRVDADGHKLWDCRYPYGGWGYHIAYAVRETSDRGFMIAGTSHFCWGTPTNYYPYPLFLRLVKTDSAGAVEATRCYLSFFGGAFSIEQTTDRGYIVAGYSAHSERGERDFLLVKTGVDEQLPVELVAFDALSSSSGIHLSFSTASETNNDYFEILRGNSSSGAFTRIAALPSQGNSATGYHYEYLDREVAAGQTYWYYLADVDLSGNRTEHRELMRSATMSGAAELPSEYALSAYPNPFNPYTTISFALPEADVVRIAVFDVAGRWIQTLLNEKRSAGNHTVSFDARDLPSGVYFARMESGRFTMTKKMLLIR